MNPPEKDSAELRKLVEECRKRPYRDEAWVRLYARYDHLIRLYVRMTARTAPVQDQEDIRQKVWIRMPEILDRFDPERGGLASYLQRACNWAVRSEYRRFRRKQQHEQPADEMILALARESPEEQSPSLLRTVVLDYIRRNMNDPAKLLIYIDWMEGKSLEEIVENHSISRASAYRRFEECRQMARAALGLPQKNSPV